MTFEIGDFVARIDANRTVKDELIAKMKESRPRQRISVTDLVNPRRAFMQRVHPELQPPLERKEAMMAGRGFHDLFGHAVSSEEYLEQFVEWEGIVGVIDVYQDVPSELKTTAGLEEGTEFRVERPSYVEQLAMYCAMVDETKGRLILYDRGRDDKEPSLSVQDARFDDLEAIKQEMRKRRDALATALKEDSAGSLPRCPWLGRGCEFESACGCKDAPEFVPTIARMVPPLTPNPEEARNLLSMLVASRARQRTGMHTLVLPRRAHYDRLQKREETDAERLGAMEDFGRKRALADAIQFGRGMESTRKALTLGDLQDKVTYYGGLPTLLRSVRLNDVVSRESLVRMFPHYFTRLAFDSAAMGSPEGRLILHYEKLEGTSRFMVYDISFRDIERIKEEVENRLLAVREATEGQLDPRKLPACPQWMRKSCPYQPACGC